MENEEYFPLSWCQYGHDDLIDHLHWSRSGSAGEIRRGVESLTFVTLNVGGRMNVDRAKNVPN